MDRRSLILLVLLLASCAISRGVVHELKKGQTLWRISQVYNVKLDTLLEVNDIDDPTNLKPGTPITIPGASRTRRVPASPTRQASRTTEPSRIQPTSNQPSEQSSRNVEESPDEPDRENKRVSIPTEEKQTSEESERSPDGSSPPSAYFDPVWPCDGRLASRFDKQKGPTHRGIRIHTTEGSLVKAAEKGNIKLAGSWDKMPKLGKIVIVFHSNDFTTVYAHLQDLRVAEGQKIDRGDVIGTVGRTGTVDRSMCYFEVRYNLEPRDPLIFLGEPS